MTKEDNQIWARSTAVSTHDEYASWFQKQCSGSQSYFASGFSYGRRQIDIHFNTQIIKLPKNARILDIGSGTGDRLQQLLVHGFEVHGIEPSKKMREYAESKLSPGTVHNGSVLQLSFEDNSFDFVYAIEVFRYLTYKDNLKGLEEIRRVLKPGGVFFGTFVNLYAFNGYFIAVSIRKLFQKLFGKGLRFHTEFTTPKRLEQMLRSSGFSKVETHGAMIACLLVAYKLARPLGEAAARLLRPLDPFLSDTPMLRPFAAHLIGIAQK